MKELAVSSVPVKVVVTPVSACTIADDVLLPAFGSSWSACVIFAVFVCAFGETTVAWSMRDAGEATGTVPTFQAPVAEL
ncbi:hypothetical protein D3C75_1270700 [compost metagenome]